MRSHPFARGCEHGCAGDQGLLPRTDRTLQGAALRTFRGRIPDDCDRQSAEIRAAPTDAARAGPHSRANGLRHFRTRANSLIQRGAGSEELKPNVKSLLAAYKYSRWVEFLSDLRKRPARPAHLRQ